MIITIVGGTGLVGQGIFKELAQVVDYELHSLSRNGMPRKEGQWLDCLYW